MESTWRQQVNALLERFGARVGLEKCALNEQGSALLAFDDVFVSLLLNESGGALLLLASVGGPAASAEIYGLLLDANLLWSGTRGATLARDPAGHTIILQRSLQVAGLEPEHLEVALESFVCAAEKLCQLLRMHDCGVSAEDGGERLAPQFLQNLLRA
jgi:hypothetical protein